jgi:hypothetical protein
MIWQPTAMAWHGERAGEAGRRCHSDAREDDDSVSEDGVDEAGAELRVGAEAGQQHRAGRGDASSTEPRPRCRRARPWTAYPRPARSPTDAGVPRSARSNMRTAYPLTARLTLRLVSPTPCGRRHARGSPPRPACSHLVPAACEPMATWKKARGERGDAARCGEERREQVGGVAAGVHERGGGEETNDARVS